MIMTGSFYFHRQKTGMDILSSEMVFKIGE